MDCCLHRGRHKQSPHHDIVLVGLSRKWFLSFWNSQLLHQESKNLRDIIDICNLQIAEFRFDICRTCRFRCPLPGAVVGRNNSILFPSFKALDIPVFFTWECLTLSVVSDSVAVRCRKLWVAPVCIVIALSGLSGLLRAVLVSLPTPQRLESWDAWDTKTRGLVFARTGLSGFGFATAEPSPTFDSCPLFDMGFGCLEKSETKWLKWLRENEDTVMIRAVKDPAEVKHESTVWLFRGSALTFRLELDEKEVIRSIFHSSSVTSLCVLCENSTPSFDPGIDDEHIRNMLASPLYLQEREASADLSQVCHSTEESLLPSSQSISTSAGKPVALMSQKRKSRQELDNDRIRMLLDKQKERLLHEARSKIVKHECRIELADNSIRELNRHFETQRVEIGHTTAGYSQSRREQAPLHEELAVRERALRETRNRGIHEMGELKRVQELRVDEFSRRRLIENQDTINAHGKKTGIAKWSLLYEWFYGFSRCRIFSQWTILPRSQSTCVIPKILWNWEECWAAIKACDL